MPLASCPPSPLLLSAPLPPPLSHSHHLAVYFYPFNSSCLSPALFTARIGRRMSSACARSHIQSPRRERVTSFAKLILSSLHRGLALPLCLHESCVFVLCVECAVAAPPDRDFPFIYMYHFCWLSFSGLAVSWGEQSSAKRESSSELGLQSLGHS